MDGEPYEKEEETFSERAMRGLSVRLVQTPIPKGIDVERDKTRGRVEKGSHSGLAVYGDPIKELSVVRLVTLPFVDIIPCFLRIRSLSILQCRARRPRRFQPETEL